MVERTPSATVSYLVFADTGSLLNPTGDNRRQNPHLQTIHYDQPYRGWLQRLIRFSNRANESMVQSYGIIPV